MPRVLIVDDHRNTRETLAMGLALVGWDAQTASGAAEAHRRCSTERYDLVVCDVRMPDGNGVELAARLRDADERLRLVLITAYAPTDRETMMAHGLGADLLIKPVTADALLRCYREAPASTSPPRLS